MILVLKRGTDAGQIAEVVAEGRRLGLELRVLAAAGEKPLLHVVAGESRRARRLLRHERVQALVPTSGPRRRRHGRRFYPYHFLNWCAATALTAGVLVALASFLPPGLGARVDPRAAPFRVEVPWYLRPIDALLDALPGAAGWLALLAAAALLLLLPALDRRPPPGGRKEAP